MQRTKQLRELRKAIHALQKSMDKNIVHPKGKEVIGFSQVKEYMPNEWEGKDLAAALPNIKFTSQH